MEKLLNDPRLDRGTFRTQVRQRLVSKFGLTPEKANELVPVIRGNRFKTGITRSLKDFAFDKAKEDGIPQAIDYIIKNTTSPACAMTVISNLKKMLLKDGYDVREIDQNFDRRHNQERAIEIAEENREKKLYNIKFVINNIFSYNNVIKRLTSYQSQDINQLDRDSKYLYLADMMIAFAARPSELFSLRFVGDKITGQLKSREDDTPLKYAGIYTIPVAKEMLEKLPKELTLEDGKNYKGLARYLTRYRIKPKDMRLIGSDYITKSYEPYERRKIKQLALRHKDLSTSLIHYEMPVNTEYSDE